MRWRLDLGLDPRGPRPARLTVNNLSVANLFEAWERQVEELDAPPEEKKEAREKLRMAREIVTDAPEAREADSSTMPYPLLFG